MTNATARSSDFLASIGVNTHINYTDGGYANVNNLLADLHYLGITQVRDTISDGEYGSARLASYVAMAQVGIKFTIIIGGGTMTSADLAGRLALIQRLMVAAPGSVTAIEGPNEINNQAFSYNGVSGLAGAVALQKDLYATVHGTPAFAGVAVDYFTGYDAGNIGVGPNPAITVGLADYDTQHPYPNNGDAPATWVAPTKALGNQTAATRGPAVYTETGYSSNGGTTGAVSATVQAKYTLDLLFDTFKNGIAKTDLYELLDAYAPGSMQGDAGYGLFGYGNVAKPVATALHNLNAILADTGTAATSFATGTLAATITGLPSTGNSMVLEKSGGTFDLVLWAEPKLWNQTTGTELTAASSTVTVDLGATYAAVSVYDPMTGTTAITTATNTRTLQVALTDHPLVIEVAGGVVVTPAATTPSATTASGTATASPSTSTADFPATASPASTPPVTPAASTPAASTPAASTPVTVTVAALPAKAVAGQSYAVADTAANIGNGLGTLRDRVGSLSSVTVTSGTLDVQAAAFVKNQTVLDKVTGGFTVSDMVSAIVGNLDTLATDAHLTSISTSGSLNVSVGTYLKDRAALDKLLYGFGITGTAADLLAATTTIAADRKITSVTTSGGVATAPSASSTVVAAPAITAAATTATPTPAALLSVTANVSSTPQASTATTSPSVSTVTVAGLPAKAASGQSLAVADTAANIGNGLGALLKVAPALSTITVTSGMLDVQAAAFAKNQAVLDKVTGGFTVSDTGSGILANLDALAADPHLTSISTGGAINVSVATYLADRAGLDKLVNGFGVTGSAADLAAVVTTLGVDRKVTAVSTTSNGVAVVRDTFNQDGTLNTHAAISTNPDGTVVNHVTGGSVLSGQSYAAYDQAVAANGKTTALTYYDPVGRTVAATLYNPDGSLKMRQSMSRDATGVMVTHASGGSAFDNTAASSADTVTSAGGSLLYTETFNRDGSHLFALAGNNLSVPASRNDTFMTTGSNETVTFSGGGFGRDTFTGFTAGDTFAFSTRLFRNFADLQSHVGGGANAVITTAAGDTLTLTGVAPSSLTASMFKFV